MSSAPEDHRYALCEADPQRRPGELQYAVYTPQERQDSDHTARREPEGTKERPRAPYSGPGPPTTSWT